MASASTSAISMALPLARSSNNRVPTSETFVMQMPARSLKRTPAASSRTSRGLTVKASSLKEKAVTGLTAAALTASMVMPEVAEAATDGLTPSLKNFLLSIAAGGIVLGAIIGAVVGVANFDPVKRA